MLYTACTYPTPYYDADIGSIRMPMLSRSLLVFSPIVFLRL